MKTIFLFLLAALFLIGGCAQKEDIFILEDRIALVDQRLQELSKQQLSLKSVVVEDKSLRAKGDQNALQKRARFDVVLQNLEDDVRAFKGKIEETDYLVSKKISALELKENNRQDNLDRVEQMVQLNRTHIRRLQQYLNLETSSGTGAPPPAPLPAAANSSKPPATENELYSQAKNLFDAGDYGSARSSFKKFISRYPKSQNADNSQFWIGETFYREKWYEKSILEYQTVIEKYPKGNKVPAALLKQALAFFNLRDRTNGRLIMRELVDKFPKSSEAEIARKKLKGDK